MTRITKPGPTWKKVKSNEQFLNDYGDAVRKSTIAEVEQILRDIWAFDNEDIKDLRKELK